MVKRGGIALLALLALACTPTLTNGAYTCGDGGACPPGWECRDSRCHATPAELGALESRCESGDECASSVCSIDVPGNSTGYCTRSCTGAADCTELGSDARCIASRCLIGCSALTDCPTGSGSDCVMPHEPMSEPPTMGSCARIDDAAFTGATGCPTFSDCPGPGICFATDEPSLGTVGVCSMWCDDDSHCPGGRCVGLLMGRDGIAQRHCLLLCYPPGTACTNGLECGRLGTGAPAMDLCIPPLWEGQSVPLAGRMRPPM